MRGGLKYTVFAISSESAPICYAFFPKQLSAHTKEQKLNGKHVLRKTEGSYI